MHQMDILIEHHTLPKYSHIIHFGKVLTDLQCSSAPWTFETERAIKHRNHMNTYPTNAPAGHILGNK